MFSNVFKSGDSEMEKPYECERKIITAIVTSNAHTDKETTWKSVNKFGLRYERFGDWRCIRIIQQYDFGGTEREVICDLVDTSVIKVLFETVRFSNGKPIEETNS